MMLHDALLDLDRALDVDGALVRVDGAEQHVHALERAAFRLLDEEPDEGEVAEAQAAEHDEGAPADVVDGVGRDFGDHEAEEPLRRRAHPDAVAAEPVGEDLAQVDPGDGAPGRGVADHVEVDLGGVSEGVCGAGEGEERKVRRVEIWDKLLP